MSQGERRLAAIMFTDIAGYTSLTQKDEAGAMSLLAEHNSILRPIIRDFKGREVKTMGDSFLVEFPSALDAVRAGLEIQQRLSERNLGVPVNRRIGLKIGIHLGDVIASGGDILGDAVNVASRLQPLCEAGGLCISGQVYESVRNKTEQQFVKISSPSMKNVSAPVEVYATTAYRRGEEALHLDRYRVAVLPFKSMSPEPNDEYFADGVTEEITTALSGVGGLAVIARTSSTVYKGTPRRVSEIGRELGSGTVVEGSVRRSGDTVRVTVQVIDSEKEEHIWAHNYDRKLVDIFALQSEIAEKVAESLKVTVLESEKEALGAGSTRNAEAYDKYLLAKASEERRVQLSYLEQSVAVDPNFALAHSALADSYLSALGDYISPEEAHEKAGRHVSKALELDGRLAEAWSAKGNLAFQYEWNWEEAESCLKRAIELNPSCFEAYEWYAVVNMLWGKPDRAIELARKAVELNPLDPYARYVLCAADALAGRKEESLRESDKLKELHPGTLNVYNASALAKAQLGMMDDATKELDRLRQLLKERGLAGWGSGIDTWIYALNSFIYTKVGRAQEARLMLEEAERESKVRYVSVGDIASIRLALGETEKAFELFEKGVQTRESNPFYWPWWCFDPLRKDERFVSLLRSVNAPESLFALGG